MWFKFYIWNIEPYNDDFSLTLKQNREGRKLGEKVVGSMSIFKYHSGQERF